jgi:hypothetical protein
MDSGPGEGEGFGGGHNQTDREPEKFTMATLLGFFGTWNGAK